MGPPRARRSVRRARAAAASRACALPADRAQAALRLHEARPRDEMPGLLAQHRGAQQRFDLVIGGARAHELPEIVLRVREQAGARLAVRGETDAVARAAERLR